MNNFENNPKIIPLVPKNLENNILQNQEGKVVELYPVEGLEKFETKIRPLNPKEKRLRLFGKLKANMIKFFNK